MSFSRTELVAWTAALAVAWAALAFSGYRTRDPDSLLHTAIEADQVHRPSRSWIAPQWAGHWNLEGYYREHPVGTFVPPILLARLGFPAEQAGYAVNALYQVLGLLLLVRLAACFVPFEEAHPLLWLAQLIPIAFTYRVRANHEQALLFFVLAALYATERSRHRAAWSLGIVASAVALALVKGVFAVLIPVGCAAWLIASRFWSRRSRPGGSGAAHGASDVWAWAGVGLAAVAIVATAAAYDAAYRAVTGESFLSDYLGRQLGVAARQAQSGAWIVARKLYNLGFYLARVFWFAMPWPAALAFVAWSRDRRARAAVGPQDTRGGLPAAALAGVLAFAAIWVGGFSLSDRLADRFVFPVYYLVAAAGALAAIRSVAGVRRAVMKVEGLGVFAAPVLWLTLFFLQLASPHLGLPYVNR